MLLKMHMMKMMMMMNMKKAMEGTDSWGLCLEMLMVPVILMWTTLMKMQRSTFQHWLTNWGHHLLRLICQSEQGHPLQLLIKKAEDAVDYEDIEEQYEGPEVQAPSEEDFLLPKKEYFSAAVSLASLHQKASVFDEENYDDEEDDDRDVAVVENGPADQPDLPAGDYAVTQEEQEKSSDVDPTYVESLETTNGDRDVEESQEAEQEVPLPELHEKGGPSLPVLCIEDGMVILRFSEIFGVHEPAKKPDKKVHPRYTVSKDLLKLMDTTDIAEEDEEAFLRGSCQRSTPSRPCNISMGECGRLRDGGVDINSRSSLSSSVDDVDHVDSYVAARPMKEAATSNLYLSDVSTFDPIFDPIEQYDWENDIVWGNSPSPCHEHRESCTISEVESETLTTGEIDIESRKKSLELVGDDEVGHSLFLCSHPVSVEPFGSGKSVDGMLCPTQERSYHPQILRLESRLHLDNSSYPEPGETNGSEGLHKKNVSEHLTKPSPKNVALLEGSWLDNIFWEPMQPAPKPKLILDLQDDQMLFEVFDNKEGRQLCAHAGAMIIARPVRSVSGEHPDAHNQGSVSAGHFNISNDKYYSSRKALQQSKSHAKKRALHGIKVMHSVPALKLQTMKTKLSNKDIANFHRPKALWFPHDNEVAAKEQGKLSAQGPMKIILKSMGGKGCKLHVDATDAVSFLKAKASKKLDFKSSERVKIFYSGKELEDDKTLAQQNVRPNSVLHLVRTKIHLWPRAQRLPGDNKPLRPPGAFKKKSELSVKVGHVFLMEYCEERPLLLGNVGMGARLCTYYQKLNSNDQTAASLRNGSHGLGTLLTLESADKSPFLGDIRPGCCQSCLETNMYRAPIFPHKVSTTDYLLVRSSKGKLSLRRIDRLYVVGQQEPHMEVISPQSKNMHTYIGNRLLVYIYREFRASEKPGFLPCVRADELSAQFPNMPESFIRKRLKHCADLQRGSNGELVWVMRRNFRIPSEEELRRMVSPEDVCTYESMLAGQHRLKRLGISRLTNTVGLAFAMNQIPDEAITLAAASHIERELQITSWNLSSNFIACIAQDRDNIERLEITGVGDPSGRGLGFSYVRVAPKAPVSSAVVKKKAAAARGSSAVTGTDADLRRLSMDAAREVLLKFNVSEEQIDKMTRWHRIAMVRKLSSEQAASGIKVDATALNKFARGQRMSFLQLQQQTREKCQEIWDRQVQSLSTTDIEELESDSEANSDLDSFAGDLENLLDAEECEDGEMGNDGTKRDKPDGVRALGMRGHKSQAQAEEEIEDEAAEAAELCRMLMDDDEVERRMKIKARPTGKEEIDMTSSQGIISPETVASLKSNKNFKNVIRSMPSEGSFTLKERLISESKEVGKHGLKTHLSVKQTTPSIELKKSKKIADGTKVFSGKKHSDKPVRESFVCGACGQLGHMRTNKNCPKYGEEPEKHVENVERDDASGKPPLETSALVPKTTSKKLLSKSLNKVLLETENAEKPGAKLLPLKFKCSGVDKPNDKNVSEARILENQKPATSDAVDKGVAKISKIKLSSSSKMKSEDIQTEPSGTALSIQKPAEMDKSQRPKKIIIKQPKIVAEMEKLPSKMVVEMKQQSLKKEKKSEMLNLDKLQKKESKRLAEVAVSRKIVEERSWEREERLRKEELEREEARQKKMFEETKRKMREQQERIAAECKRYSEARSRDVVTHKKGKLKKKKKKLPQLGDVRVDDQTLNSKERRIPERDRAAKRRPLPEVGRHALDHIQQTKRRRGGEVGLSNILENIVERLKEQYDVSYLFLKPVSKKEAPDYLDIIAHPMDLATIKEKVRRMEYKSSDEFRHDVWQISYNAHKYNDGRNPGIPPLADQLLEICDDMLDENRYALADAEAGIEYRDT
ncbi:transcription initiation factor TFIID subunit 1 isoform X2 [Nymphaea colorata]|nr:transcription initiation factor TFIID subunit 1 isoform X2 [Nymphaea colorata]